MNTHTHHEHTLDAHTYTNVHTSMHACPLLSKIAKDSQAHKPTMVSLVSAQGPGWQGELIQGSRKSREQGNIQKDWQDAGRPKT